MSINRRSFLQNSLAASVSLSLKASLIGVPASFLVSRNTTAAALSDRKYSIFSGSDQGENFSLYSPGSYAANASDPMSFVQRASDFETPVSLPINGRNYLCAKPYENIPKQALNQTSWVKYTSPFTGHGSIASACNLSGALRTPNGTADYLPAAIARQNAALFGTTIQDPINLQKWKNFDTSGAPLPRLSPKALVEVVRSKSLTNNVGANNIEYAYRLRNSTLDNFYKTLKQDGTKEQRKYLDEHAFSFGEAQNLQDRFGSMLDTIGATDNYILDELICALACFEINLTPVVMVYLKAGQDNHDTLAKEVEQTQLTCDALNTFWTHWQNSSIADQIVLSHLEVFGMSPNGDNNSRSHYGDLCQGFVMGSNIKGGIVGGVEGNNVNNLKAMGFNAQTGSTNNPNITANETLSSWGKTIMCATGIPLDTVNNLIAEGRAIEACFV